MSWEGDTALPFYTKPISLSEQMMFSVASATVLQTFVKTESMTWLPRGEATVCAFLLALQGRSAAVAPWSHLEAQVAHAPS